MERLALAIMCGEIYLWYPNADSEEIRKERERIEMSDSVVSVNTYNIQGLGHQTDFENWKDALTNRKRTFKRSGFLFNDNYINALKPEGFIVFVRLK